MLIMFFTNLLAKLHGEEEGQTAIEYALVLALIAVVLVAAVAAGLGGVADTAVGKVTTALGA
jgi:Flp pilus assembly pilin Flp